MKIFKNFSFQERRKNKQFFYNEIADKFDDLMNKYDLRKRMNIIFNCLLKDEIKGKKLLDAGCGTGFFSKEAIKKGAKVTSLDISDRLLKITKEKCKFKSKIVKADILSLPFPNESFDIVLSTEVIEHTQNPRKAIFEFSRVLKKRGILVLTTPNKVWYPAIFIATKLKVRPYEGLENWVSLRDLKRIFFDAGLKIEKFFGFHLFPFFLQQFTLYLTFLTILVNFYLL